MSAETSKNYVDIKGGDPDSLQANKENLKKDWRETSAVAISYAIDNLDSSIKKAAKESSSTARANSFIERFEPEIERTIAEAGRLTDVTRKVNNVIAAINENPTVFKSKMTTEELLDRARSA